MNHSIFSSPPNPPGQSTEGQAWCWSNHIPILLVGTIAALSDSFIGYKDGAGCSTMECNGKDKSTLFAKQKMDQLWREIIKVYYHPTREKSSCSEPEFKPC